MLPTVGKSIAKLGTMLFQATVCYAKQIDSHEDIDAGFIPRQRTTLYERYVN